MAHITITVETTNFNLDEKIPRFREKLLDQLANNTKILFEKNTPIDSGRASNAYQIKKSENQREITNDTKYLGWVNDGTGIYGPRHQVIRPRHASVLHFHWRGKEWFLKSVKGQKGQKFVERSMTEVMRSVESAVVIASSELK